MPQVKFEDLLNAGVHFGHLKRKWNPAMAPYIFMERNGIHIFDLHKTAAKIEEAANALKQIAKSGRKILFVATKKQAKDIIAEKVSSVKMPYVVERWPGGMLTNFPTIRKAVKKMSSIDKLMADPSWDSLSKREKLQITRQRAKLEKTLGSIADLTRLPAAMFVVDVMKENIAVKEAVRLNIPVFGIVDTNSDPTNIDFVIPANDDATKSIELIVDVMVKAIEEGIQERKAEQKNETGAKAKARKDEPKRKRARKESPKVEKAAEAKPEGKSEAKVEEKAEEAKPEGKPEVKPEVKAEVESKGEAKAEEKKEETK